MNIVKLVLGVLVICLVSHAFSQQTNEEFILQKKNTKKMVRSGRRILLNSLTHGDSVQIIEVIQVLTEIEDTSNYVGLTHEERSLIGYLLGNYKDALVYLEKDSKLYQNNLSEKLKINDYLFRVLLEWLNIYQKYLKDNIRVSTLPEIDKQFLQLNLEHYRSLLNINNIDLDSLDYRTKLFTTDNKQYEAHFIISDRFDYSLSNWGLGFEFFTGFGSFTDELGKNFDLVVPIGIAFDFHYKRIALSLRDYIGISKTTGVVEFEKTYAQSNATTIVFIPEASIGFNIINRKNKLSPFIGISSMNISPGELSTKTGYENITDPESKWVTTYSMGLCLDINLGRIRNPDFITGNGMEHSNKVLRMRYAYYMPGTNGSYDGLSGYFHSITIGYGGFGRRMKRAY